MNKQLPVQTLLKRRVRRGARLLDERQPGWHRQVNQSFLDLADSGVCVLGQLHGGYGHGLAVLGFLFDGSAQKYGFDADFLWESHIESGFEQYSILTELWIEEIKTRNKN